MTATLVGPMPTWAGPAPAVGSRAVVVAPHPDDEVLGTGVLLRWLHGQGVPTVVVAVTDGEASHARSIRTTPAALRRVRAAERDRALAALGVSVPVVRLGLPDGEVAGHETALAEALAELLRGRAGTGTTLVAPWRHDGHPDHDASGRAAAAAVARAGGALWEVAIWAKIRDPAGVATGARLLHPDAASATAKRAAALCFASQVHPLGPLPEDGPVVHPHELAAALAGPEPVWCG